MRKIVVFASGRGSNFEAIVAAIGSGSLRAECALLVTDRPDAPVVERAKAHHIPVTAVSPKKFASKDEYEDFILEALRPYGVSLICLAGYMRIVGPRLLNAFPERIINLHPSLLPAFKGAHAIYDAFRYGVKVYGITVHFVDATLDGGKIIAQEAFNYDGDDYNLLESRIHELEHRLYPAVIDKVLDSLHNF